jgi:cysteinyl-tRNA synthetase
LEDLVFGHPESYLDVIMRAGFDGIYLDGVDSYARLSKSRPTARDEMVDFVRRLATYARKTDPGFIIVPQGSEELLSDEVYLQQFDGIAKANLLFGSNATGAPNPPEQVVLSIGMLRRAESAGLPIFIAEQHCDASTTTEADRRLTVLAFIPCFASRSCERLASPCRNANRAPERRAIARAW